MRGGDHDGPAQSHAEAGALDVHLQLAGRGRLVCALLGPLVGALPHERSLRHAALMS